MLRKETKAMSTWSELGITEPYPVIEVSGSPRDMGRQHGEKARQHVSAMMEVCFGESTLRLIGGAPKDVIVHTERLVGMAEQYAPDLVEECRGIAEGAGYDFREIFALQYFCDYGGVERAPQSADRESCSTGIAVRSAVRDGHSLLAWTDDMDHELVPATVILRSRPDQGPAITAICFAGTIPEAGVTRDRAIACNSLFPSPAADGVPYVFIPRKALQQPTLQHAVNAITSAPRVTGMNFALLDPSGDFVDIETLGPDHQNVTTSQGYYAHTNHVLTPEFAARSDAWHEEDSERRLGSLQRFLGAHAGAMDWERMVQAMSDHGGGVCNHEATLTCMVCDLTERRVAFSTGPPCLGQFQEFALQ
jgi:isopenicillin-N N-acyltransferase-like protein